MIHVVLGFHHQVFQEGASLLLHSLHWRGRIWRFWEGEVIVRVNINDVNDNAPQFDETDTDSELVASVPTTAQYGHRVTRIEVIVWKLLVLVLLDTPISVSISLPTFGWHQFQGPIFSSHKILVSRSVNTLILHSSPSLATSHSLIFVNILQQGKFCILMYLMSINRERVLFKRV